MVIAIDFDGTCVTHAYPEIGEDIGAVPVLKEMVKAGHLLILYTMRSDISYLPEAVNWFKINDIELYGIQTNPTQKEWTNSPKVHANMFIDDAGFGVPLKYDLSLSNSPFIDWVEVKNSLINDKII